MINKRKPKKLINNEKAADKKKMNSIKNIPIIINHVQGMGPGVA
jgi:hypothetical protein